MGVWGMYVRKGLGVAHRVSVYACGAFNGTLIEVNYSFKKHSNSSMTYCEHYFEILT